MQQSPHVGQMYTDDLALCTCDNIVRLQQIPHMYMDDLGLCTCDKIVNAHYLR